MTIRWTHVYTSLCALLIIALAGSVIYGWYTHNQALVQINPAFAPMQYNTALGFFLCGFGLLTAPLKINLIARLFGLAAFALGFATLIQYIFDVDFMIDEFFVDPVFTTKTSHAGRMAPNTALCLSLCGLALMMVGSSRSLVVSFGLSVFALAIIALSGYAMEQESIYGWGNLTRMAIHTASGFIITGFGLIIYGVWGWSKQKFDFWNLAPFCTAVLVATLSLFSWYIVEEETKARNNAYFNRLIEDTHGAIINRYTLYEGSLRSGLGLYYASEAVDRKEWTKYVNALQVQEYLPGINGIGYIDYVLAQDLNTYLEQTRNDNAPEFVNHPDTFYPDKFIIKFIEPYEDNKKAVGLDIGFEANRRAAAERARDLGVPALTKKILLVQDQKKKAGFLLLAPVYETKTTPKTLEERRTHFQGWVYAPFIGAGFLGGIDKISKHQLDFQVYDGKKVAPEALIYTNQAEIKAPENFSYVHEQTQLKIAGRTWTILWEANDNYAPPANKKLGPVLLASGLGFAGLLYLALGLLLRSKEVIRQKVNERTRELKESEEQFRLAMDGSAIGMALVSTKGKWLRVNKALTDILGYSKDELLEIDFQTVTHKDDIEADLEQVQNMLSRKIETYQMEKRYIRKDGQAIWGLLNVALIRNENGSNRHFIAQIQDITATKTAKDNILKANMELKRSNQELERFAYIASHDLQEPLRKIGGFTERLEKHIGENLDEKSKTYMGFITGGVLRMRELIMGLLEYSRVTTSESNIQKLNTNEIISVAADSLSETIADNKAQISYVDLPTVYYDKVLLTQMFQNLIGNAIKYRSERDPVIEIRAAESEDEWTFSVQDNGMGMEEKYLERIFEMFQRLHRKEDVSGTGIGLSLCQKIAERYGGKIWVTSTPGEGSTFFFTVLKHLDSK